MEEDPKNKNQSKAKTPTVRELDSMVTKIGLESNENRASISDLKLDVKALDYEVKKGFHELKDTIYQHLGKSTQSAHEAEEPSILKSIKKQICAELNDGKDICDDSGPVLTHFKLDQCHSIIRDKVENYVILTAHIDGKPIKCLDDLKSFDLHCTVTQCSKIKLPTGNHLKSIKFGNLFLEEPAGGAEIFDPLAKANQGKVLCKLNPEIIRQYQNFEEIKLLVGLDIEDPADDSKKITSYFQPINYTFEHGSDGTSARNNKSNFGNTIADSNAKPLSIQLQPNVGTDSIHHTKALWDAIKKRIPSYKILDGILNSLLGDAPAKGNNKGVASVLYQRGEKLHPLPFTNIQAYRLLKSASQAYLWSVNNIYRNNATEFDLQEYIQSYGQNDEFTPYIENVITRVEEWREELLADMPAGNPLHNFLGVDHLPAIELIWSYWVEQGMLVQTMNAISLRFQNISLHHGNDPLAQIDIDPLRPLANLFWGYMQDEQHTLTIKRRAYEYDHTYGLSLQGAAVPTFQSVDSRSKFIEAFHNLLHSVSIYLKESDDTTRVPDAFVTLNNLREVHLLLAEGNHNAYGNLTWTARQEMLIQQYLLGRPEMREFLGGRIMVPYRENWMDRVDRMKQIQNWGSTSITHYYDLAQHGEIILLTIRAHDWSNEEDSNVAGSWVASLRNELQRYIHSYRTVTGVDLSADSQPSDLNFMQPSVLISKRLKSEQRSPLRSSRVVSGN